MHARVYMCVRAYVCVYVCFATKGYARGYVLAVEIARADRSSRRNFVRPSCTVAPRL